MADTIRRIVTQPGIVGVVGDHFDPGYGFAGHTFDDLGENPPNEVTVADLLAVTLLDVAWSPRTVRFLLGDGRQNMSDLLAGIGPDVDLWEADDDTVNAADAAWQFLVRIRSVGRVKAGKLLARKRPRLPPIFDRIIERSLPYPEDVGFWKTLRAALDNEGLRVAIAAVRPEGEAEGVSLLRLFDVAVWMSGSRSRPVKESHRRHGFVPPL